MDGMTLPNTDALSKTVELAMKEAEDILLDEVANNLKNAGSYASCEALNNLRKRAKETSTWQQIVDLQNTTIDNLSKTIKVIRETLGSKIQGLEDKLMPKCPRCNSNDRQVRKAVYSDISLYDFTECGDPWHGKQLDNNLTTKRALIIPPTLKEEYEYAVNYLSTSDTNSKIWQIMAARASAEETKKYIEWIAILMERLEQAKNEIKAHENHRNAAAEVVGLKPHSSLSLASAITKKLYNVKYDTWVYAIDYVRNFWCTMSINPEETKQVYTQRFVKKIVEAMEMGLPKDPSTDSPKD